MIKLIASDLDGTLLLPDRTLPPNTFDMICALYEHGVVFAPSSGRQLPNLKKLFAPVLDKIAIIAENGGLVWYGGKVIYSNPTPAPMLCEALEVLARDELLHPVLSADECAYFTKGPKVFEDEVRGAYNSNKKVSDLFAVAKTANVLKISVWDGVGAAEHGGVELPPQLPTLRTIVSGKHWLDISIPTAHKGAALSALMAYLGALKDETMAFGDHMNDLEMLQTCGHPYIMATAFDGLAAYGFKKVDSNANCGVLKKCEELL